MFKVAASQRPWCQCHVIDAACPLCRVLSSPRGEEDRLSRWSVASAASTHSADSVLQQPVVRQTPVGCVSHIVRPFPSLPPRNNLLPV